MTDDAPETPAKPALKDASTNPWYVLMTVAGEQDGKNLEGMDRRHGYSRELHARNRRYFNGWMAKSLSEDAKQELIADGRATPEDLADLTDEETAAITQAFADRCPNAEPLDVTQPRCNLAGSEVTARLVCVGFVFSGPASFSNAAFSGPAYFHDATFSVDPDFHDATFSGPASFSNAAFSGPAYFHDATFSGPASFSNAAFSGYAFFSEATFSVDAVFSEATFSGRAHFERATFSGYASFSEATFSVDADFSDSKFKARTAFANVTFQAPRASPPRFYNAELHEDTSWEGITTWPLPGPNHDSSDFVRAYEKLKLLMDDKNKLYSEHMFHRLELQSRQIAEPTTLASRASRIFGWASDYGWSISHPATGLFLFAFFGWIVIFLNQALLYGPDQICRTVNGAVLPGALLPLESIKLSLSNMFGFLGFARTFMRDTLGCLTPLSEIVSMAQTFFGVILLFLLGLALRNRFRLR